MDDDQGGTFLVPALSLVPPAYHIDAGVDRNAWSTQSNDNQVFMTLLDGLAVICVVDDTDVFATGFDPASSTLYLASNHPTGVPKSASDRVSAAINYMLTKAGTPQRRPPPTEEQLQFSRSRFIKEQFQFSKAALTARIQCMGPVVGALDRVLTPGNDITMMERCRSPGYHNRFTEEERTFLREFRDHAQTVLDQQFVESSFQLLYLALQRLSSLVQRLSRSDFKLHKTVCKIGFAVDVPILYHAQRLVAIVDGIDAVLNLPPSHGFYGSLNRPRLVELVPGTGGVRLDPDDDIFLQSMRRPFYSGTSERGPDPIFGDFYEKHIVRPLRAACSEFAQKYGPPEDRVVFTVPLHPEIRVFQHIHDLVPNPVPYIGLSELACVVCFDFMRSHNEDCKNPESILLDPVAELRGTHGRGVLPWGAPELACGDNQRLKRQFFDRLALRFRPSTEVFRSIARAESKNM